MEEMFNAIFILSNGYVHQIRISCEDKPTMIKVAQAKAKKALQKIFSKSDVELSIAQSYFVKIGKTTSPNFTLSYREGVISLNNTL